MFLGNLVVLGIGVAARDVGVVIITSVAAAIALVFIVLTLTKRCFPNQVRFAEMYQIDASLNTQLYNNGGTVPADPSVGLADSDYNGAVGAHSVPA